LQNYTDTKVADGTNGSADTTYVDNAIAGVNSTITAFQATLDDKINTRVASLGTFVGTASKYAQLPTTDQNGKAITAGDFAHLTAKDGSNKKGLYRYDGNAYVFISGDPAIVDILNTLKATTLDDTVDDKFVTPKWVKDYNDSQEPTQEEVNQAVGS